MSSPKGYSSQEKDDRLSAQFSTIEPVRQLQNGLSVLAHQFMRSVTTDAVEANSTTSVIVATSHSALKGDVIRFTSGTFSGREIKVWDVSTNSITLAETLASAPALGVSFEILRHKYPIVDASGNVSVSGTFTEVATAADGGALPALTKVVSGYDGSAVQVLKTNATGELQVGVVSSTLPTGAATESTLSALNTKVPTQGQALMAASVPVVIASNQSAVPASQSGTWNITNVSGTVSLPTGAATETTLAALNAKVTAVNTGAVTVSSSALPTGAATETTLSSLNGKVTACNTGAVTISSSALPTGAATESTLSTLNGKVTACNTGAVTISSSALPTGAATETTLAAASAKLPATLGQKAMASSLAVTIASDQSAVYTKDFGLGSSGIARIDYASTSVSTAAYTQVIASTAAEADVVEIFDSSGQVLVLATGAAGSEADKFYIFPGGNGRVPLLIPAGTRIAIKAIDGNATAGQFLINLYG